MQKSPPTKTLCFDLDGTLCTATKRDYSSAEPFPWAIERVNALAEAGHEIIIMTARGAATGIDWSDVTREQLGRWGVRYDELRFGKPRADVFIDDRGVHTDAWRADDAFGPPGYDRGGAPRKLPTTVAGHVTSIVESGRTFGGRVLRRDEHVERVRTVARAAGVRGVPAAAELREAVERVVPEAYAAADEDVVFSIRLSDLGSAAHLDLRDGAIAARRYVSCRPLRQVGDGVLAMIDGPGPAVSATTDLERSSAWPVAIGDDGAVEDLLGGDIAAARGTTLTVPPGRLAPSVAAGWLAGLAASGGLMVVEAPLSVDDLHAADEVFIVGFPFCLVPLAALDDRLLGGAPDWPVARRLLDAWSEAAGIDLTVAPTAGAR